MEDSRSRHPANGASFTDSSTIAFNEMAKSKSPVGLLWFLFGLCVLISIPGPIGLVVLAGCAFGIASFWLWQRRLTVRRIMKLGSTASPFTKVYLPVVLSSGWQSLIGVAFLPAALAYTIAPDYKAPAAAAAPIFFWIVSYFVSLFSPIFTLKQAAFTAYARTSGTSSIPQQLPSTPAEVPAWLRKASIWCVWAAVALVVLSVLLRVTEAGEYRNAITIFGEFLGVAVGVGVVALIPAAVAAGVSTFFRLTFSNAFRPAYALVLLLMTLALFGTAVVARIAKAAADRAEKSRNDGLRSAVSQFEEALDASEKALDAAQQPTPSGSDMERVGLMIKHAHSMQIKLVEEYSQALSRDGLEVLLDPERVYQDKDFSESMAIADKMLDHVKNYRAKEQKLMFEDLPNYTKTLGLPAALEEEVIKGYKQGLQKAVAQQNEVWDLEKHILDQFIAAIAHLKATRDRWEPQDGLFTFARDSDLKRFNEIMARVEAAVARQADIQKAALDNSRNQLEKLKKLTEN